MKRASAVTALALLCLGAMARADIPITLVGQWGGTCKAVAVSGNRAYMGIGPRLAVMDVSNPANSTILGMSELLPDFVQGVAVCGNYAYVADGSAGLQVIGISNPASPTRVGGYDTSGSACGVAVSGSYAYVADGDSGLQVIDISNPASPTRVGGYDTSGSACGVAVSGSYAYVADGDSGLQVIDITNPASPTRVGGYDTSGCAYGVAVSGSYAYVADGNPRLQVIDISNPAAPTHVGGIYTGWATGVAVSGNYAYVTDGYEGLQVIDISNPASPTRKGGYDTSGWATGVAVSGSYAYVANGSPGLQVIDISNPASPTRVGGYNTGCAYGVVASGNYAYVAAGWWGGLQVIDISNPASPTRVGGYDTFGCAYGVAVSGSYAYLADGSAGLQVIDITNPSSPTRVGGYGTWAYGVVVSGNYACVVEEWGGALQVIDISNPSSPTCVGRYDTSGCACGVAVSGNYAYVADSSFGLQVIDISTPASPTRVGGIYTSYACGVAVSGSYAYVADGDSGLQVIDISNPASPTRVGGYDTIGSANGVAVSGNYAYVADGDSGLQVIDISNPASPTRVGGYDTSGSAFGVAVSGNCAYVADSGGGIVVLGIGLAVTSIAPNSGPNTGIVSITDLAGANFQTGATVKLTKSGQSDIAADNVTVVSATKITCSFNLVGKAPGAWNVVVTNPGAQPATLANGFAVIIPAPSVATITPNSRMNTGRVSITDLAGTDFQSGATVKLTRSGQSDIAATSVNVVSTTKITCSFNLAGKAVGQWNVVVTNPDAQSGTLANGFTVTDGIAPVIHWVAVSPAMAADGDAVHVVADVSDSVGVTSVKANGTDLTHSSGSSWSGDIIADSALGLHTVTVVVHDAANNSATNGSQSYRTAQALFIKNRDLVNDVTAGLAGQYLFITCGRVTWLDADTFELDDGSATPVRVSASGHGLATNDFAIARGIWSLTASPPTLNSRSAYITPVIH